MLFITVFNVNIVLNHSNYSQKFASGETYAEQGSLKRVVNPEDGQEKEVIVTKGSYTIVDKDGSVTLVNYTADETGFHPEIG